jgi:hypothetical protein
MILSISFTGAGSFRLRMRCFFGAQWSDSVVVLGLSGGLACFEPNAVSDRTLHPNDLVDGTQRVSPRASSLLSFLTRHEKSR